MAAGFVRVYIKETGATPGVLKREFPRMQRHAFNAVGVLWHRKFRLKHFTFAGFREYRYTPRSPRYERRKLKKFGHRLPLVYTGQSRALSGIRDVRATSKGNRIVIHARALNFQNPHSKVRMRDEMVTVSDRERMAIYKAFDDDVATQIKRVRTTRRRKLA